jgi:GH15 family glucan-1,4-alpha-glucosidase
MPARIEDYAMIGDCNTAALISCDGSIDWLCLPRFDSGACFAALLGTPEHGRWLLAPAGNSVKARPRYRESTLILETDYETPEGAVTVLDFMPPRGAAPCLVRRVTGRRGQVPMHTEIIIRFDYGALVPWVQRMDQGISAIAGPNAIHVHSDVGLHGEDFKTVADFSVSAGESKTFVLSWHASHLDAAPRLDAGQALEETDRWWREWSSRCSYQGPWRDQVLRSLITLKALTYAPSGGIAAAVTTSLPEMIGGVRNWDYRYCWLRDATFTLYAFLLSGYTGEARAWREWLLRAVAGSASQLHIVYGVTGERRLDELELEWLPGYEHSTPVRIGNAAYRQFQLDVFGEVMDAFHLARQVGLKSTADGWRVQRELLDFLESHWDQPDEGIWEIRGPRQHFTHSKVMAWVAFDRAIKDSERLGLDGPVDRWRAQRETLHREICLRGYNPSVRAFTQRYDSADLDASLLMMAQVGFLPAEDDRIRGTVEAIERHLMTDGFVARYHFENGIDGLPPGEGAFLPCTFWLADNYALQGRFDEATRIFTRLLGISNGVGLLSEEYEPTSGRMVGNFPQAFSHVALVNTAHNLLRRGGPAEHRKKS